MPKTKTKAVYSNELKRYRKRLNLRVVDIAKLMDLESAAHISHWEKGRKLPSLVNALKLSVILNCPVITLFFNHIQEIRKDISRKRSRIRPNDFNQL